ncbi:hypothetical protein Bca4012_029547 [Brassica carinata]
MVARFPHFQVILYPNEGDIQSQAGLASVRSDTTSTFTSIAARLEKLRKEKDGVKTEKNGYNNNTREDLKSYKSSPNFHKLNSMIDRNLADTLPSMMKFTEDQIGQLSFCYIKKTDDGLVARAFQLLFSLRNRSLDLSNGTDGTLPTVCKRLILALSTSTLMFAAKIYQIPHICEVLRCQLPSEVDPYLFIGDDLQLHVRPNANMKDFGSSGDNQMAASMLFEMRSKVELSNTIITDIVAKHLSKSTKLEETDVRMQLSEPFTPDDDFMFGSRPIVEPEPNQSISKESSLSFDEDVNAGSMVEDEATSELSALEVAAGQVVVVSSVSTSPLPYNTMTNRCETFGTGTTQKISKWLATENSQVTTEDNRRESGVQHMSITYC